ncbi:MAG: DUF448 domain-containing protein [Parvibaculales bacterium]
MVQREHKICLVSGSEKTEHLVRLVIAPDGKALPDLSGKAPGPGLWVAADKALIEQAFRQGLFVDEAGQPVACPPDFFGLLERQMEARLLNLLGLARRAGALMVGYTKVEAALKKGEAQLVLSAADAAADGRSKIAALGRRRNVQVADVLSVDALSKALGLENVVHAAVTEKGWSDRVGQDISRMALYHGEVMNLDGGGLKQRPEE